MLSIAAFALNIGILGFMPLMFLFIPIVIPFGDRGSGRDDDDAEYCPGCGSPLEPGYDFCTVCGRRLHRCPGGQGGCS